MRVPLVICAAFVAAMPAAAWADDPNDPAMRRADALARDREMTRQLNLEELGKVRRRDMRPAKVARAAHANSSYAADEEYSARLRDLASAPAQRIELAQSFGLLAGGDLLGKQSAGHRAVRQSPHPVAAGDVDAA